MSLIHRIKSGTSTDANNTNYWYLERAVRKACMDSKQSGKSVVKELASMITPMVEELQKIVLSETATVDEKLAAGSLAQQILSKAVANESSVRHRSSMKKHTKLQERLLEQRKIEREERRAKKAAKVAETLRQAEEELRSANGN